MHRYYLEKYRKKFYNGVPQVRPQQTFDFKLVKALSQKKKVEVLSIPPIAAYPKTKCIIYKGEDERISESLNIKYLSLLNLPIIKNIVMIVFLCVHLFFKVRRNKQATIMCGYLSLEVMLPTVLVSKIMKRKAVVIIPNLPELSFNYSNKVGGIKNYLIYIK